MKNTYTDKIKQIHAIFISFGIVLMMFLVQINLPRPQTIKVNAAISGTVPVKLLIQEESINEINLVEITNNYSGKVTWYGNEFHGRLSANGDVFNEMGMTAASNVLPFGTRVLVMYQERSVEVTITDRGGFTHDFDLSKGAFMQLAPLEKGVLYVDYTIL